MSYEHWKRARDVFVAHYNYMSSDPRCHDHYQAVLNDFGSGPWDSKIRMSDWSDRPADQTGDRHNEPGITHLTPTAFERGDRAIAKTLFHEHMHRITSLSHLYIYDTEDYCIVDNAW